MRANTCIRAWPVTHQTISGISGLFDDNGLQRLPEIIPVFLEVQVLPKFSLRRSPIQFQITGLCVDSDALQYYYTIHLLYRRQIVPSAACQGNPSSINEYMLRGAVNLQRGKHMKTGNRLVHAIINVNLPAPNKRSTDFYRPQQQIVFVHFLCANSDRSILLHAVVSILECLLVLGARQLPIAQPEGQAEKKQPGYCRPQAGAKNIISETHNRQVTLTQLIANGAFMRIVVILFLLFILASLGSALFYLVKDKGQSERTVKALTLRISLSLVLFIMLMASYYFGWIPQTGIHS